MALNVNINVTDTFYRYKMPKLITKVEGKGNGIKTVIVNMTDIGKALSRPATYPTKFFGCELGAQTQFDVKNERYIVNGDHSSTRLQELLHVFIRKFVLCSECDNPETNMIVKVKSGIITLRCQACGFSTNVDMRHKLTTFILKNPPNADTTHGATPSKKDKKNKKEKEKDRSSPEANKEQEHDEVIEAPPINNKKYDDDDDEEWGHIDAEAEKKKRMEELSAGAAKLVVEDDIEKSPEERLEIFYNFVKSKKDSCALKTTGVDKMILSEAERLEVKDKAVIVLVELLLSENILKELNEYRLIFLRFTHENPKAQKYLIGGLEQLIGTKFKEALMAKVSLIFKQFYELDILEEEVFLEWDKKVSKKYVSKDISQEIHNKAAQFITWLKEAEEEEDESEDDGVEIEYKEGVSKLETQKIVPAGKPSAAVANDDEDDDDLDIDAL